VTVTKSVSDSTTVYLATGTSSRAIYGDLSKTITGTAVVFSDLYWVTVGFI